MAVPIVLTLSGGAADGSTTHRSVAHKTSSDDVAEAEVVRSRGGACLMRAVIFPIECLCVVAIFARVYHTQLGCAWVFACQVAAG